MRKVSNTFFLALILSSVVLLGVSFFYAIDTYRVFGFPVEITEIRVYQNETSGEYTRVEIDIQIYNPSLTLPIEYNWADTYTVLNGQQLEYGGGIKYRYALIPPGTFFETSWYHPITEGDQAMFQNAETSDTWMWFEFLQPNVDAGFLGQNRVNRPLTFEGVILIPI
ncbi:MAG: hypothetical protein ACXADB_04300 [Candidatus Hermodarchaeia archaeon]|jgi:hypothetical protein